jgi:Lrp/AsnC family leucine-responsive transcriptional regulator
MDVTDKSLLQLLQTNSKRTTKELASKLNLSVTAVYERIKKLEREGIINKYVAVIDKSKIDKNFVVFCQIKLLQQTKTSILGFEKEIIHFTEVLECFNISGDFDYMLKIVVKDMDEYREFLVNKLSTLHQIGSKQSIFMIGEVKNSIAVPM